MKNLLLFFLIFINLNLFSQRDIHERWDFELKKFVNQNGKVDYRNWSENRNGLKAYISVLEQNHPEEYWSKNQIISYWINTYNALTINLILDNFPLKSIREIKNPWGKKLIHHKLKSYTLDEIEHQILRKMKEPRIHFAINCASISCPNLSNSAYFSNTLNDQLDNSTRNFLKNKNSINPNEIKISKIFLWFKKDFGDGKELLSFIEKYSMVKLNSPKIEYLAYDWNLNNIK